MSAGVMRRKEKRWQRERMVAGMDCNSVVARMKSRCAGGSSMIFSSALNALVESMCTSSIIYTRVLTSEGVNCASSRNARILSTPLLEAASISSTSMQAPESMLRQAAQ